MVNEMQPEMCGCIIPECTAQQTLAYFLGNSEMTKTNWIMNSCCESASWMKGEWKLLF